MGFVEAITVRVGADISAFRAEMAHVITATSKTSERIGAAFTQLRQGATQAATAIAATLGVASTLSIKAAGEFETGLAKVQTLVKLPAEGLAELGEAQRALATEFGTEIVGQLGGLYDAISSGVTDAAGATEHMHVVNTAAVAGWAETRAVGEAIVRLMIAYRKEHLGAADASDVLFRIVDKGIVEMNQLAPIIGNVAGVAAASGVSVREMAAALATLTLTTGPEEAATRVIALFQAFAQPGKEAVEVASKLGVRLDAVALSTKGVQGVMQDLARAIGADAVSRLAEMVRTGEDSSVVMNQLAAATGLTIEDLSALFPNIRALQGALALMSNEGKNFTDILGAIDQRSGATAAAFDIMAKTPKAAFDVLQAELKDTEIAIGQEMLPVTLQLQKEVLELLRGVREWIRENPELAKGIAEWAVKLGGAAAIMLPLSLGMQAVSGVVSSLIGVFKLGAIAVGILNGALTFLLANPIVLLVAAIAAAVALIIIYWDELVAYFQDGAELVAELWSGIVDAAGDLWDGIVSWFTGIGEEVSDLWESLWDWAGETLDAAFRWFDETVQAGADWIVDGVRDMWDWIVSLWEAGGEAISDAWEWTWNGIKDFFGGIVDWITDAWDTLIGWIRDALEWIGEAAANVGQFFGTTVPGFFGFAEGGYVTGPAGRDRVPAALSAGEFVVNPDATSMYRPLLEAINRGQPVSAGDSIGAVVYGGLSLSFPNVRTSGDAREVAEELDRLLSKGIASRNRRGLR